MDILLSYWSLVESDFQREYNIDLIKIKTMTWRRFRTLTFGLSPSSLFMQIVSDKYKQAKELSEMITDQDQKDQLWNSWGV